MKRRNFISVIGLAQVLCRAKDGLMEHEVNAMYRRILQIAASLDPSHGESQRLTAYFHFADGKYARIYQNL